MDLSIRPATGADADSIYLFVCALQEKSVEKGRFIAFLERCMGSPLNIYLVAEDRSGVIGFLSCHGQDLLHHMDTVFEIQEMYVEPEFRSKGVGSQLLSRLLQQLNEVQYDVI